MLKMQSLNHFCGICLAYVTFGQVYHVHIWNSGLVHLNSQNTGNLEADNAHQTTHETDLSETYGTTPTHTKQLSMTRGSLCNISSLYWYIPGIMICLSYVSKLQHACWLAPSLPDAPCRCTPAPLRLADLLCFSHWETDNTRLWPAKLP
jgi:hypothetical protein